MNDPVNSSSGISTDIIELRSIRASGTHGVLDEEKGRAQPFEVDLDLHLDLRMAGSSDRLVDTVDYGAVAVAVVAVVEGPHVDLLEHLAERIARAAAGTAVGADGQCLLEAVTVTVRKLRPPVPVDMATAAVRIHRHRADLPRSHAPRGDASRATPNPSD